ncbi:fha domain protein [Stemphylium lycopersici]|uniref:Fha domain protein n=1 Tax=Stemphylium lycopersici TaxID=183478 RepID=A0A364N7I0_STELY|nr:fha domain protein [Stemphylium lycopersici]
MASCKHPFHQPAMLYSTLTDLPAFRIVLRDVKRYDTYETREFDLSLNSTFPIGRASSNVSKKELMAAPHNAYIDSPVISRQHALLSANSTSGFPEVYLSDQGSMHGTILNGKRLPAKTPTKLKYGDEIQFGTDVNRNEGMSPRRPFITHPSTDPKLTSYTEFFVARKYVFESQLSRPFSLGFTVPDAESEDDEVQHGYSKTDPLVIDDSDAASDQSDKEEEEEAEEAEVTMAMTEILEQNPPVEPSGLVPEEYPESAMRTTLVDERYDDGDLGYPDVVVAPRFVPSLQRDDSLNPQSPSLASLEDEAHALGTDFDSEDASIGSSEVDSDADPEIRDSEDDMDEVDESQPIAASTAQEARCSMGGEPSASTNPANLMLRQVYNFEGTTSGPSQLPRFDQFGWQRTHRSGNTGADVSSNGAAAPPLPPRPSSTAASWGELYNSFGNSDVQGWYSDETPQPNYLGTNFGDRPSLFSPAPPPSVPEIMNAHPPVPPYQYPKQVFQADRLQTPPPVPEWDGETCTPLQPGRRTKVSIEEIVEEQPPTPESVNNMKRKADVLEEEPEVVLEEVMIAEQPREDSMAPAPVVDNATAQTSVAIAQRPKRTPRSIMSKVLKKATYPLLGATGAVVSFALLSTLPDTFFV